MSLTIMLYFNSLPHAEVDIVHLERIRAIAISTHYLTQRQTGDSGNFTVQKNISTHYLTQRQTEIGNVRSVFIDISTHYLTQRQTKESGVSHLLMDISTHYLTQRQTSFIASTESSELFQLTTSRRGRHSLLIYSIPYMYFNSLPHAEVDIPHFRHYPLVD